MYLSSLLLLPLIGSVAIAALPAGRTLLAKQIALGTSLLTAILGIVMALQFDRSKGTFQFVESHEWITSFGVKYGLGIDGTGLVLILMALILAPIVILASWNEGQEGRFSQKAFFALLLILETFMVGVFAATDVFLFYVFFEAMLIPVYFLIGSFGGPNRSYAAVKFLLYSLLGGLLMLAAVIGLYILTKNQFGTPTFDVTELTALNIDPNVQR